MAAAGVEWISARSSALTIFVGALMNLHIRVINIMRCLMIFMSTFADTMSRLMIWMNSLLIAMRPLMNFMRRLIKQPNSLKVFMSRLIAVMSAAGTSITEAVHGPAFAIELKHAALDLVQQRADSAFR